MVLGFRYMPSKLIQRTLQSLARKPPITWAKLARLTYFFHPFSTPLNRLRPEWECKCRTISFTTKKFFEKIINTHANH
jgi:hypothetical protein